MFNYHQPAAPWGRHEENEMNAIAQLFLVRSDDVEKRTAALKAVAGQDLPFREAAAGVLALSGNGEGASIEEAIKDAVMCAGKPTAWRAVNVTYARNQYVFADVLIW